MGNRSPYNGAFSRADRKHIMLDRNPVLARGYKKSPSLALLALASVGAVGAGALPPPRPRAQRAPERRVGTGGGDNCDTNWVQQLLAQAQNPSCQDQAGPDTLPFPASGNVLTTASSSVSATLQRNGFIGRRLVIPDSLAAAITIDDVKVGGRSIFTSANSITGEAFSTKAEVCTWLRWPKISAGFTVVVYFTNISGSTINLRGSYVEGVSW